MVPEWIGWVVATFALYHALSVVLWLIRGSARTVRLPGRPRNVTYRDQQPAKYWALVAYNALIPTPILAVIAWAILTPHLA
jgi:hypothetical protein